MKRFERKWSLTAAALAALLASGVTMAQAATPAAGSGQAQPTSQTPGQPEVKQVGDWFVRCFPVQSPSPCDIFQELDDQRSHQRVLALSIAYVPSMDRYALQITVPLDISIPKGAVIQTDSYKSAPLPYRRCDRNGCYVEMAVDKSLIEALAKSGRNAKVSIVADNGKKYALVFYLNGFGSANDEMMSEARAKAKPVEKTGAQEAAAPTPAPTRARTR